MKQDTSHFRVQCASTAPKSESPTPTCRCPRLRPIGVGDIDLRDEEQGKRGRGAGCGMHYNKMTQTHVCVWAIIYKVYVFWLLLDAIGDD